MGLDFGTEIWMLGNIAFGGVFYMASLYYASRTDDDK